MSTPTTENHRPGFAQPVRDAQKVFRAVLKALAGPTAPQRIDVEIHPPAPLGAAAGAIVLALCDDQTPVWLDPALRASGDVVPWISFHTGARFVDHVGEALFVVASPANAPRLAELGQGSDEEPHRSATLILDAQETRGGTTLTASGPGIRDTAEWDGAGLPAGFLLQWQENRALFPRGVDVIVAAGSTVRGLPRTTALISADTTGADTTGTNPDADEKRNS
ncbi:alpha-D-ribose 1-methylphosphonate 5-triphosphate synthase subunit PhnH [Arthrobacter subterraneus]|uniref:Alpha-D-ribose 1-methylphosphonate 5-triphosphate synthase subunit PhnH n=1 Tax=Arthrobacter subterraneus TaxID=335973 RepID=A0A1G8IP70_9MICC|nr:phosphonate C-P lyase system protein PhnH [Arthrobacter subterraneus]SDI20714.1 alpha-D-ribose 1-methylphosphonate 5-triphosphate synthase subunit PhnH [Arthrobacter subterraneus]